jgi:uncharacterized membrane protein YbaN (DUF454 family)
MLRKSLRIGFGFLLLAGGLIGWLLPVIPGWAMVIPGLLILSREFHWARKLLAWLRSHFPKQAAATARNGDSSGDSVGKTASFRDNESPRD